MTLEVSSPKIYTKLGVPISVDGVAQVKIESKSEMLHQACQQFLGKSQSMVSQVALETLEGHQRAIMGGYPILRCTFRHPCRTVPSLSCLPLFENLQGFLPY